MSSSPAREAQQSSASNDELVWEIFFLHCTRNEITDRCTQLTSRGVCRMFRMRFAEMIKSVTLHSLANVEQLLSYMAPSASIRSPWRTVAESRVFKNLRSVQIPTPVTCDLHDVADQDALVAALRQFDLHVEVLSFEQLAAQLALYNSIGTVSALTVGEEKELPKIKSDFDLFRPIILSLDCLESVFGLSTLTCLTLLGVPVSDNPNDLAKLRSLVQLESLRRLEIRIQVQQLGDLSEGLQALASLSQVTDLDLTIDMDSFQEETNHITAIEGALQQHAPKALTRCHLRNMADRLGFQYMDFVIYLEQAMFKAGKLHDCFLTFSTFAFNTYTDAAFEDVIVHGIAGHDVQRVRLMVPWNNAENAPNPAFSTKALKNVKELEFTVRNRRDDDAVLEPFFSIVEDNRLAATSLNIKFVRALHADYTKVVGQIPSVLPHLRELRLNNMGSCPDNLHVLSQLTGLTYLSLDAPYEVLSTASLNLSGLPPLLKALKVSAWSLAPEHSHAPTPPLIHLTRLDLSVFDGLPLSVFYGNGAPPLKELTIAGQEYLGAITHLFPHLEKLHVICLRYFDQHFCAPAELAGLKCLRDLHIHLPECKVPQLRTLTQLLKLRVDHFNVGQVE